jgi:hypothetical protein
VGRFRNFLSYDRRWLEELGSEDSHGRALWALGIVINFSNNQGFVGLANNLFTRALPAVQRFTSPRAWAFSLLGMHGYLKRFSGDRQVQQIRAELADQLMYRYEACSTVDWPWFEDILTYDNPTLSRALLLSGDAMYNQRYVEVALNSLRWLIGSQYSESGHFVPIGCHGFYRRGGIPARFDQQPIETYAMVAACLDAYRITGDTSWHSQAKRVSDWFLGHNDLQIALVDQATGACYDGLQHNWVNQNQGAESTLASLLTSLDLRLAEMEVAADDAERLLAGSGVDLHR